MDGRGRTDGWTDTPTDRSLKHMHHRQCPVSQGAHHTEVPALAGTVWHASSATQPTTRCCTGRRLLLPILIGIVLLVLEFRQGLRPGWTAVMPAASALQSLADIVLPASDTASNSSLDPVSARQPTDHLRLAPRPPPPPLKKLTLSLQPPPLYRVASTSLQPPPPPPSPPPPLSLRLACPPPPLPSTASITSQRCAQLQQRHNVVVGRSWGSLTDDLQREWSRLRCDKHVVAGLAPAAAPASGSYAEALAHELSSRAAPSHLKQRCADCVVVAVCVSVTTRDLPSSCSPSHSCTAPRCTSYRPRARETRFPGRRSPAGFCRWQGLRAQCRCRRRRRSAPRT